MATKKEQNAKKEKATVKKVDRLYATINKQESKKQSSKMLYAAAVIGILVVIAIILYSSSTQSNANVPFSTFKQNFNNANRVSIAATYLTEGQFINESQCFSSIIQIVSHTRLPSTIDFYLINQTSCTYSSTGLGNQVTPITTNASYCIGKALNETSIFLNYSLGNTTIIQPQHMYIYGDSSYMKACPIAADFA